MARFLDIIYHERSYITGEEKSLSVGINLNRFQVLMSDICLGDAFRICCE
jgi:hypothetical protein